jgi:hypothetical protein
MNMSFLKRFFMNVLHEDEPPADHRSSFERVTDADLEAHLGVDRYGDFLLPDAIRPSYDLMITPREGYRRDVYRDTATDHAVPVLMAAASREKLFELFLDCLDVLGHEVDVVLETSHRQSPRQHHQDLYREHIDLPVLKSILWDFDDLLLNDGCTGIAVMNPDTPQEVQFDEHKLLIFYGEPLEAFEQILDSRDLSQCGDLRFLTEAEHVHSSKEEYVRQFDELKLRLGIDDDFC